MEVKTPLITMNLKYENEIKIVPSQPVSSTDMMVKQLSELVGLLKSFTSVLVSHNRKEGDIRSTQYSEVVQAFKNASKVSVKFLELQMVFRAE